MARPSRQRTSWCARLSLLVAGESLRLMTDADWHVAVACLLSQSEEDQQLKNELEMLVERLKVRRCLSVAASKCCLVHRSRR
jgi:hypothetical protein